MPRCLPIQQPAQFQFQIMCPACECGHGLRVGQLDGPNWTFNGDLEKPTFYPSLLITAPIWSPLDPGGKAFGWKNHVCHSFITNGEIQYLGDCTHKFAGQTVPLPEI